jgi:hypothetical protein
MQTTKFGGVVMPTWLAIVPSIISAVIELIKLLADMYKQNSADEIKQCSAAIAKARASGDISKLTALIEKMGKGSKCD